jgi:hypothetical protein
VRRFSDVSLESRATAYLGYITIVATGDASILERANYTRTLQSWVDPATG